MRTSTWLDGADLTIVNTGGADLNNEVRPVSKISLAYVTYRSSFERGDIAVDFTGCRNGCSRDSTKQILDDGEEVI
jgi:hypothetical protein